MNAEYLVLTHLIEHLLQTQLISKAEATKAKQKILELFSQQSQQLD